MGDGGGWGSREGRVGVQCPVQNLINFRVHCHFFLKFSLYFVSNLPSCQCAVSHSPLPDPRDAYELVRKEQTFYLLDRFGTSILLII